MRLNEITEVEENEGFQYVKDLLVFLKMKGVKEVNTNHVLKELRNKGIMTEFDELFSFVSELDFIQDIKNDKITFKVKTDDKELVSNDKLDQSKETVAHMARRARKRREQK
jgi:hypothetical protein